MFQFCIFEKKIIFVFLKKKIFALCFCGFQRFLVVYVMSKIQLSLKNS